MAKNEEISKLSVSLSLEAQSFSKQMTTINKEIKNAEKEFKSAAKGVDGFENSFTGLDAKIQKTSKQLELYNKKLDKQKEKYSNLEKILEKQKQKLTEIEQTQGKGSEAWTKQAQKVQKVSQDMSKLSTDIKSTENNISKLNNELQESQLKFTELGNKTQTLEQKLKGIDENAELAASEFERLGTELNGAGNYFNRLSNEINQISSRIQSNQDKLQAYENEITQLNTKLESSRQDHSRLASEIQQVENALQTAQSEFGQNSTEARELQVRLNALRDSFNSCEAEIEQGESQLREYQTQVNRTQTEINELSRELTTLPFNNISQSLTNAGNTLKSVGSNFSMYLTGPIVAAGAAATNAGVSFDSAMSKLQATSGITDKTSQSFKDLSLKAQEMGASTSFSATDAANGLTYLALAGWDVETSISRIEPVLRAAEAGGMDLALCADLVTDSMSSASVASEDFSKYLDIVAQAQRKSNTSMQQMLEAYVGAGGLFNSMNIPLEKSAALLGVLANRGTKGSEAANALISTFANIVTESGKAGKALNALNISLYEGGKRRDMIDVLKEMAVKLGVASDGTSKLTEKQQDQYAAMVGGKTQFDTLMKLLAGVSNEYDDLEKSLEGSNGALMEMATTMKDNLGGSLDTMKSAVEGALIDAFHQLEPLLKSIIDKITDCANWFNDLSDEEQQSALKTVALVAAIGPLLSIIGNLLIVGGSAAQLFSTISLAASSGTGIIATLSATLSSIPFTGVIAGVAGAVVVFKALNEVVKSNTVDYQKMHDTAKENIETLNTEIDANNKKISSLEGIAGRYDELKNKVNRTKKEEAELKELTGQIAEIMPELVSGYDANGDPILNLNGNCEDYIQNLKEANKQKSLLLQDEYKDQAEASLNLNKQTSMQSNSEIQEQNKELSNAVYERKRLWGEYWNAISTGDTELAKSKLSEIEDNEARFEKATSQNTNTIENWIDSMKQTDTEVKQYIQSYTQSHDTFAGASEGLKETHNKIVKAFDFSDINPENLQTITRHISETNANLSEEQQKKVEGYAKKISELNSAYEDGKMNSSDYEKQTSKLAKTISELYNISEEDALAMIRSPKFDSESLTDLENDLEGAKTNILNKLADLQSLDDKEARVKFAVTLANSNEVSEDVRTRLLKAIEDGNITDEEMQTLITAIVNGEVDTTPLEKDIDEATEKTKGKDKNVKVGVKVDSVDAVTDINTLFNYMQSLDLDKDVSVDIQTGIATGDINLIKSSLEKLPEEKRLKVIAAIENALQKINTVDAKKLKEKIAKLKGDNTDANKKIKETNDKNIKEKTAKVKGDNQNAMNAIQKVEDKQIKDKTFHITGIFKTIGNVIGSVGNLFTQKNVQSKKDLKVAQNFSKIKSTYAGQIKNASLGVETNSAIGDGNITPSINKVRNIVSMSEISDGYYNLNKKSIKITSDNNLLSEIKKQNEVLKEALNNNQNKDIDSIIDSINSRPTIVQINLEKQKIVELLAQDINKENEKQKKRNLRLEGRR